MLRVILVFAFAIHSYAHKLPPVVAEIVNEATSLEVSLEEGKALYVNNCMACHGEKGIPYNSRSSSIPYLAGQTPQYLLIHMAMFKTEHRTNNIMNPIAKKLSTQDMANLKAYLVSDEIVNTHCDSAVEFEEDELNSVERGRLLAAKEREFQRGDGSTVAISCTMCHGDHGLMPDEYRNQTMHPDLAALGKTYLLKQFNAFKDGSRTNAGPMNIMVRDLTKRDLKDLSAYYSSLDRCKN